MSITYITFPLPPGSPPPTGKNNRIKWTLQTKLDKQDFAGDKALLSHNCRQMQELGKTHCLERISSKTGLKINKNMKVIRINVTINTR